MEDSARSFTAKGGLPLILLAAVVQGWVLYGLHHAIQEHHWPATDQRWLVGLYALAVFLPVTLQLLARHARSAALWCLVAALAAAYFYFGWHYGADVYVESDSYRGVDEYFALALQMGVLWLLALPFAQTRLTTGRWSVQYRALFADAWRNKLALGEAALFTGLFWLLLFLWMGLFHLLHIDYFKELFQEPIFIYPVTSLTFGCALHLIGSIDEMTSVVLQQILNVLKWLGLVAGVILAFFTVALVFSLPGLVFTGQKAIDAAWLLWLIAVMVLLLNAAYRDGSVPQPYPAWMAMFLRGVVPLMLVVSATALYCLFMRSQHYGLTVERWWGFVVAFAAFAYSAGYSASVFAKGAWLMGMARINVWVALALILVIAAALTPPLSPYRLAADSQFHRVQERGLEANDVHNNRFALRDSSLQYLRFDAGRYGLSRLQQLAVSQTGKDAAAVQPLARQLLAQKERWLPQTMQDAPGVVAALRVFPAGRTLDPELTGKLVTMLNEPSSRYLFDDTQHAAGIFIDLNGDNSEEFIYMTNGPGRLYEKLNGHWQEVGSIAPRIAPLPRGHWQLIPELSAGHVSAVAPRWKELVIGGRVFGVQQTVVLDMPAAADP